jgi:dihydroflavonol-4-reductase
MKALVTGANGHIGGQVVRAALRAGMQPIAFVRPNADRRALAGLDVEVRMGDILDLESLKRGCDGVEVLFHVAAPHRQFAVDAADITRPTVEGTRNAIAAARATHVRRVVYTSTGATVGYTADPKRPLTESDFLATAAAPYARGKIEAERVALEEAERGDLEVVVVNPSATFGPRDHRLTPASRAIVGLLQGDPAFLHLCISDVRDVGAGHVLAATKGRSGRRYLLVGDPKSPAEVRDMLGRLTGIRPATFLPPRFVLKFLAARMEKRAAKSGGDAPLTRAIVEDNFGRHLVYDGARAWAELGATFRPAEDTLRDAIRWLLFVGALKPSVVAKVRRAMGAAAEPDADWSN